MLELCFSTHKLVSMERLRVSARSWPVGVFSFRLTLREGEGRRFVACRLRLKFPVLTTETCFLSQGSVFLFAALAFPAASPLVQKTFPPLL